ncbi:MAG: sulfite exporter TauE/SafE family protein [Chthoniobacter sp.]|uniref:sulfite exporter TauE/SafE family protein n=1 Tax=Chthoniobacter sp. TaxID=2510640 RepID=UPI0032A38108
MNASFATPIAALVAGLATSVHCTAMCGPLACALRVRPIEYHASRFLSYALAGTLCGAAGQTVATFLQGSTARLVPWAFIIVLIVLGLGLETRLPQPRFVASFLLRARLNRSLGWLTPLLPCGPLWLMLGAAAITGSWWSGGLHMASFVAGTIPLPLLLQTQARRVQRGISPQAARWTQQALAFVSAGVLVWRAALPLHASCH